MLDFKRGYQFKWGQGVNPQGNIDRDRPIWRVAYQMDDLDWTSLTMYTTGEENLFPFYKYDICIFC